MRIAVGCDPNAMDLKNNIIQICREMQYEVIDFGSEDPIYANTGIAVAQYVASGNADRGILACGTGLGMSIAANKVKGAYAALLSDVYSAKRAVKSNNSNIACLGAFPNFSAIIAKYGKGPYMLCANLNPDWPGMVSMLAAGGALDHLGIDHFRATGDFKDPKVLAKIIQFAKCASVVTRLNGQKYGLIGGRSLEMYSATVSMQDWMEKFGIDVDHMDQEEIVRQAADVPEIKVEKAFQWLTDHCGAILYDERRLTPEKLKQQIRHYEAIKKITADNEYDFVGVKCHYEMSRQNLLP